MTEQQIQAAFNELTEQVYAPVFFEKMAQEFGIVPETPEEAQQMLVQAAHVKMAAQDEMTTGAKQDGDNLIKTADAVLGLNTYSDSQESVLNSAADELLKNEKLAAAINSLHGFASEQEEGTE